MYEDLGVQNLKDFLSDEADHNLLMFADTESRRHARKLANNLGVDFEPYTFYLKDNSQVDPQRVTSKNLFQPLTDLNSPIFDRFDNSSAGVVFGNGVGAYLDPNNQFVFPILRAEQSTVSVSNATKDEDMRISSTSGEQLTLVAGYQTRYNNRAAVAGSTTMCSDQVMTQNEANMKFCKQLASWVFQESGVLRTSNLRHNKKGEACESDQSIEECPNPENYKIEDHIEFYVDLEQKTDGVWQPYIADDIQL